MKTKKILAMLLSAMIVMSTTAVSVSADELEQGTEDPGATHSHEWSDWSTTVEPTCTATGTETRVCSGAGECNATSEETTRTVNALGHDMPENWTDGKKVCRRGGCGETITCEHENTSINTNDATCTENGSTVETCGDCGKEISNTPILTTGHSFAYTKNADDSTHAKNCLKCDSEDDANEPCTDKGEGTCVCGRTMASQEPECTHESTKYVQVGGTQHKQKCTANGCDHETTAVDCTYTEAEGTKCVCGREKASQEEPPAEEDCTHEGTLKYVQVGDTQHKQECTADGCDHETTAVDCTYTEGVCVCGREEASTEEPEDKPSTGGSSSSSSSSSTTTPSTDTKANTDKIANAKAGEKVEVKLEGKVVPADYIKSAQTSKATVVIDYGAYAWEISNVTEAKAVDLSINTDAKYLVNQNELKDLKGDNSNVIDIAHDGKLGFKGTLKYNVDKKNAGKFVNLYYYNPTTKKLELQGSTKIGADGNVFLPFTHCSTYVLNITDKAASAELFEDFSAGESATVVEETLPAGDAPAATEAPSQTEAAANPATGNSAAALVAIPVAIAAAAIISKKR